ncbi:MAG: hypothetical protein IPO82_10365 [Betaproteobacteria bacterium]|nr:hypothetical protein [Betaproteobacteria bacterium]MBK9675594.1 hypothetical protein [Betaproteobacteria bacterium]
MTGERAPADGQKLQLQRQPKWTSPPPNRILPGVQSARSERQIIFDGKTVTLHAPARWSSPKRSAA